MGGSSSLCASRLRLGKPPQGFGRRQRAVPTIEKGGASRLGAAAPFVSIGRGAAPSGPLTSGDAVAASRRWRARFAAGSRTAAARRPYHRKRGRVAPWCGSTLRVHWEGRRAVGDPDFRLRPCRFSEMGGGSSLCASRLRLGKPPQGVGRRQRAVPTIEKGGGFVLLWKLSDECFRGEEESADGANFANAALPQPPQGLPARMPVSTRPRRPCPLLLRCKSPISKEQWF